ncbi:LysM peptidoglycan-binding domain-containing protein, partial [Streptomyces misionensis]
MISGNGRHRRPRQAPALLVAAGVTGSAIAIPLLGAASAHAADGTTWDKVAGCESGGSWSADTGNGYYGGLQISQDDWIHYGGTRYASSADQASRSQQIAVAEKILADKGTLPWATCALLSGLTPNSGSVDVDPGVGGNGQGDTAADPSGLPDASSSSGTQNGGQGGGQDTTPSGSGNGSAGGAHAGSGNASSADPSTTPPSGSGSGSGKHTGKHTGKHAAPHPGASTGSTGSTGSSASGAGKTVTTPTGKKVKKGDGEYKVVTGDTLSSIAAKHHVAGGWHKLFELNKDIVDNADLIYPGQQLHL